MEKQWDNLRTFDLPESLYVYFISINQINEENSKMSVFLIHAGGEGRFMIRRGDTYSFLHFQRNEQEPGLVAQTCNPSTLGG